MQENMYVKEKIEKHADMVYRIALTRCGTIENAEDIFQEVFLNLVKKCQNLRVVNMKRHGLLE